MAPRILPDQAILRELLDYDPLTGLVFRLPERTPTGFVWQSGEALKPRYYWGIGLIGCKLPLHRVIWKWMTREDPQFIDHKDNDGLNNRWKNLRDATKSQNGWNSCTQRNKKNGLPKGVQDMGRPGCFYAVIAAHGVTHRLGRFPTAEAAHEAYCAAARRLHGEFWHSGHE